ncbi:unnamed protein product [Oreochromis niloticus]|nr:unnamed protein product [Mustela putorius furo]
MDPADSSREYDLSRIQGLMKRISHTKDTKTMAVGINAIKAILEGNPHLRQLRGFMGYMDQLHEAQEVLQARELSAFARSQFANPKPPQQHPRSTELPATQQRRSRGRGVSTPLPRDSSACYTKPNSPASFLAAMWSEDEEEVFIPPPSPVSSATSVPSSGRKRRSCRRHPLPQLDSGTSEQPAGCSLVFPPTGSSVEPSLPPISAKNPDELSLPAKDCFLPLHSEQRNPKKTVSSEPIQRVKLCSGEHRPPPSSCSLQTPLQPEAQLAARRSPVQSPPVLQSVQSPPVQSSSVHSLVLPPSPPTHFQEENSPTPTFIAPEDLATFETLTLSRASPEGGYQHSVSSGPLDVKKPAQPVPCLPEVPGPAGSVLSLPEAHVPAGSVLSLPEARVPAGSVLSLPEARVPAGPDPFLPEARAPTGSALCVPGAPVPTGSETVFAGGPEEPVQPSASSAGGPEEPDQLPASSAGGPEEPVQLPASSAGGPEEPVQLPASSAGGPEEPIQPQDSPGFILAVAWSSPRLHPQRRLVQPPASSSASPGPAPGFILSVAWSSPRLHTQRRLVQPRLHQRRLVQLQHHPRRRLQQPPHLLQRRLQQPPLRLQLRLVQPRPRLVQPRPRPRLVQPLPRPRLVLQGSHHLQVPNCRLDIIGHLSGCLLGIITTVAGLRTSVAAPAFRVDDHLNATTAFRVAGLRTCSAAAAAAMRAVGPQNYFYTTVVAVRTVDPQNCLPAVAVRTAAPRNCLSVAAVAVHASGVRN